MTNPIDLQMLGMSAPNLQNIVLFFETAEVQVANYQFLQFFACLRYFSVGSQLVDLGALEQILLYLDPATPFSYTSRLSKLQQQLLHSDTGLQFGAQCCQTSGEPLFQFLLQQLSKV